jgi:ParB-like chromosome segregation protein Spo0J
MLALAHTLEAAIRTGKLRDQAEAARRLGLTRARMTQLLALLQLAPDLQERVLCLEAVDGREPVTERDLRPVTRALCWADQRAMSPLE